MSISRRNFIVRSAAAATALAFWQSQHPEAQAAPAPKGPFQPNWDSLAQYQCPEWFRDAKFGIWAHWDAQCVPEMGQWYARDMYQQGTDDYHYHVKTYGHPSKVGFKDIDHIWHAENWDPEHLMRLYKAAGAKYFMALAQHHDNLDCWDSTYQPWNSVAVGPKKDIVGTWARLARAHGMRLGVSCHGSRTWSWMEPAQGADATGPLAGVPYDGRLTKADGVGQWWEGLDPEDLYAQHHRPMGSDFDHWSNRLNGDLPSPAYCEKFYNRTVDLLDKYHPDLLYFDDAVLPLYEVSDIGLRIAAYHYNSNTQHNHGRLEAVLNGKDLTDAQQQCLIQDYERGASDVIRPYPWQTDTCIGSWHYNRAIFEDHAYKTPAQVIRTLVDIVSKNGNLMLNIPVKGDGTIDSDELAFLQGMAAWMTVNGESIFSTRPWKIYGEGPIKVGGSGRFTETNYPFTARDIRFTTKEDVLYVTALEWPNDGKITVRALAADAPGLVGSVKGVSLLGHGDVPFTQTAGGLVVTMPADKPCDHAYALKIAGLDLSASQPVMPPDLPVHADATGTILLLPEDATPTGQVRAQGGVPPSIGFWDDPQDTVSWNVHFDSPGSYAITARTTAANGDTAFVVDAGAGASLPLSVPKTSDWYAYETVSGRMLKVDAAGDRTVTARAADPAAWHPVNLASLTLRRAGG